jgi:hypothetical protein
MNFMGCGRWWCGQQHSLTGSRQHCDFTDLVRNVTYKTAQEQHSRCLTQIDSRIEQKLPLSHKIMKIWCVAQENLSRWIVFKGSHKKKRTFKAKQTNQTAKRLRHPKIYKNAYKTNESSLIGYVVFYDNEH